MTDLTASLKRPEGSSRASMRNVLSLSLMPERFNNKSLSIATNAGLGRLLGGTERQVGGLTQLVNVVVSDPLALSKPAWYAYMMAMAWPRMHQHPCTSHHICLALPMYKAYKDLHGLVGSVRASRDDATLGKNEMPKSLPPTASFHIILFRAHYV